MEHIPTNSPEDPILEFIDNLDAIGVPEPLLVFLRRERAAQSFAVAVAEVRSSQETLCGPALAAYQKLEPLLDHAYGALAREAKAARLGLVPDAIAKGPFSKSEVRLSPAQGHLRNASERLEQLGAFMDRSRIEQSRKLEQASHEKAAAVLVLKAVMRRYPDGVDFDPISASMVTYVMFPICSAIARGEKGPEGTLYREDVLRVFGELKEWAFPLVRLPACRVLNSKLDRVVDDMRREAESLGLPSLQESLAEEALDLGAAVDRMISGTDRDAVTKATEPLLDALQKAGIHHCRILVQEGPLLDALDGLREAHLGSVGLPDVLAQGVPHASVTLVPDPSR